MEALTFIDEHSVVADAAPEAVWDAVNAFFERRLAKVSTGSTTGGTGSTTAG